MLRCAARLRLHATVLPIVLTVKSTAQGFLTVRRAGCLVSWNETGDVYACLGQNARVPTQGAVRATIARHRFPDALRRTRP